MVGDLVDFLLGLLQRSLGLRGPLSSAALSPGWYVADLPCLPRSPEPGHWPVAPSPLRRAPRDTRNRSARAPAHADLPSAGVEADSGKHPSSHRSLPSEGTAAACRTGYRNRGRAVCLDRRNPPYTSAGPHPGRGDRHHRATTTTSPTAVTVTVTVPEPAGTVRGSARRMQPYRLARHARHRPDPRVLQPGWARARTVTGTPRRWRHARRPQRTRRRGRCSGWRQASSSLSSFARCSRGDRLGHGVL